MAGRATPSDKVGASGIDRASRMLETLLAMDSIPRPPDSANALIDATERAVARYGFARTSMSDLAREAGVARTTLYRQVDSVDQALALCGARVLYEFLDETGQALLSGEDWQQLLIDTIARVIDVIREHPLVRRMLEHEPEIIGGILTTGLGEQLLARLTDIGVPIVTAAMATQQMRAADPHMTSELLVRTILGLVVIPSNWDVKVMLEFALGPILPPS
ncbi:TetR/AcrR family transcriptional regulator [Nocardia sp. NPDC058379]|uniref:TetR/AcrR family transcriptional regulator n=1 Tax=unclassified Nocardia TaxID=2637762 RepID=UPI00365C5C25